MENLKIVDDLKDEVIELRREIHMYPETAFEEYRTSDLVFNYLSKLGLDVKKGVNKTGVVADLKVESALGTVLLRADMDALPIQEENNVKYKSKIDGKMHACGHDSHTAMLLVAAKVLTLLKDSLQFNVRFIFQPSEERDPGGAIGMIREGVLENPHVDFAFGLHVAGFYKANTIFVKEGIMMAEADSFKIKVKGSGGHGAYPHKAVDPIMISSHIVLALQSIISREVDPLEPAVLSFGKIFSGDVFNVIPETAELQGTVRTLKEDVSKFIKERIEQITIHTAHLFRASAILEYNFGYPPLVNDKKSVHFIKGIAKEIVGENNIHEAPISMGGEDMAYFLRERPGAFYWLGALNEEKGIIYPNHSPKFDIDEDILPTGVKMHVATVLNLEKLYK
ncbi:M20 metallopeptidase family protein [Caldisericum exile]|uniref:Peptidase M20 family protein n=1 Tax=Caldisericum exile (strain DSM 21853 / NBRC 104410 / AZM16c01) TaxID=511051 RepID=A0A7U6JFX0_CALEA|nr:amidohydrolase [Caldisericum exile]BAL80929.1 peptidase M20 family protein [Caldisericum exile AZM16c01]